MPRLPRSSTLFSFVVNYLGFTSLLYPKLTWPKRNAALSGRALTRLSLNLASHLDLTDVRGHPHHDRQTLGAVAAR
jgi:hypothetical protein